MKYLVLLHLLGAIIWIGGYIHAAVNLVPKASKSKDPSLLANFEANFHKLGYAALLLQLVTGIMLAFHYNPEFSNWFNMKMSINHVIITKLLLLVILVILAVYGKVKIFKNLTEDKIGAASRNIIFITIISLLMMFFGLTVRMPFF